MKSSSWQPIIGLEVHFELKTESKMFCPCPADHFGKKPNTQVCPVCLGMPGTLPVPNEKAIDFTLLMALALGCRITSPSHFDRKNYFYPDLPKGYQISQHFSPLGKDGRVKILLEDRFVSVKIKEIHLEEDTAKLIHRGRKTLIDFNRSGVPLVEVVSAPCLNTPLAAKLYLKRIQQLVRWLGISDGDMEKGSLRCEANISVRKKGERDLPPYRVELKNINSFRFVERALEYEINRQIKLLEKGQTPRQETRGFDPERGVTFLQRSKETAPDYRYFPEPDIPPFRISQKKIASLKKKLPPLPWEEEERLIKKEGINPTGAQILVAQKEKLTLFYQTLPLAQKQGISTQKLANLLINRPVDPKKEKPSQLIARIKQEEEKETDEGVLGAVVDRVIKNNPQAVADFKKGKTAVLGFFIGQVQKETGGKADPRLTARLLEEKLKN